MLIIDYLEPNEPLDERYCRGSTTCYAFTNNCKQVPLDKDGNLQYDKAIDISKNEKLKENLRKTYINKQKDMEQARENMATAMQDWLSNEIGN